ncbi:hypothetical protein WJX72_002716 [[Myrmecia] bisecta]|uniref:Kinesin-like protein n=1 Tax=[Myrmecia] bisecta TaxID=41462 RepID=A0AAW1P275_9CHLO
MPDEVKPLLGQELNWHPQLCIEADSESRTVAVATRHHRKSFYFDQVLGPDAEQEAVFSSSVVDLVDGFIQGLNATVLAYGQTGSGKTYTMGTAETLQQDRGMLPRVMERVFDALAQLKAAQEAEGQAGSAKYEVSCQFLEVYNDEVRDLLQPDTPRQQLSIREHGDGQIRVSGAAEIIVGSLEEMQEVFHLGSQARTVGMTLMNERSSRSHAIFTILLRRTSRAEGGGLQLVTSKFHLVDLAGSERTKKLGARGLRFKESVNINQGLLALGNVISALGDPARNLSHVPYRDSKITRLLQDSLGGNSQTCMIACISMDHSCLEETLNTLKYADRARNIKNTPVIVQKVTQPSEVMLLQAQLLRLLKQHAQQGQHDPEGAAEARMAGLDLLAQLAPDAVWDLLRMVYGRPLAAARPEHVSVAR